MIILFGDALARARMFASSIFGYGYVRRQVDDYPNGYHITELRTKEPDESAEVVVGHHQPLDHNFFQENQSEVDYEFPDNSTSLPLTVFLPLGVMLLFAALILLVVMFRRHPGAVMTVAAVSLLAAGAYNLVILFHSSDDGNEYQSVFDPLAPPKYE